MSFLGILKKLDANPKIRKEAEEFYHRTMSGGLITIVSGLIMTLLFVNELRLYASINTVHELVVDTSRGETIKIEVNVTFPRMPCSWLSLDTMDVSGDLHLDVDHDMYKQRLDASGRPKKEAEKHDVHMTKAPPKTGNTTCGPCYGAEDAPGACCNTCDEVRAAYRRRGWALGNVDRIEQCKHDAYMESIKAETGEGCKMWGHVTVNKVAGNFHFAPGRSYQQGGMHVHDVTPFGDAKLDFSHIIHRVSFGASYPGMKNPLDGVKALTGKDAVPGMYQYFLKVVPTSYTTLNNGSTILTNQYSVTENYREGSGQAGSPGRSLPGVFFFYDLSPIKVKISETKNSFTHFLTSVCAIVGGIVTVATILDSAVFQGGKLIKKKRELGKFS